MLLRLSGVALAAAVAVTGLAPAAWADWSDRARPERPVAAFDWSMPELTRDADGDGLIDADAWVADPIAKRDDGTPAITSTAVVPEDGRYAVTLDASASTGAERFVWRIWTTGQRPTTVRTTEAVTEVDLPEGRHLVTLRVAGERGWDWEVRRIDVQAHIVVGLGDSYSAGAGFPGVTASGAAAEAYHAMAALDLETSDDRSSVIFVHLSRGGATIANLLGRSGDGAGFDKRPQVDQARDLVKGQPIDYLLLTIGGNDTGFGQTVACLGNPFDSTGQLVGDVDCPPLAPPGAPATYHDLVQQQLGVLANGPGDGSLVGLPALQQCLEDGACETTEGPGAALGVSPERIVYTLYPDLTKDDDGALCQPVPFTGGDPLLSFVSTEEWRWADEVLTKPTFDGRPLSYTTVDGTQVDLPRPVPGLNAIIAGTKDRWGWSPVTGIYAATSTNGYCAEDRYTFRNGENPVPVHPNLAGHRVIADEITTVIANG